MSSSTNNMQNENPIAPSGGKPTLYLVIGACGFVAVAVWLGVLPHMSQDKVLKANAQQAAHQIPRVEVVSGHWEGGSDLTLPGNIQAITDAPLYARTSGYVTKRYVDIGSRVHAGQLLAEIDAPEARLNLQQAQADTDKARSTVIQSQSDVEKLRASVAQTQADAARAAAATAQTRSMVTNAQARLAQAKASKAESESKLVEARHAREGQKSALVQSQAQLDFADTTAARYKDLLDQGFVARQDNDQAQANLKVARAATESAKSAVNAADANVQSAQEAVNAAQATVDAAEADVVSSGENVKASLASEQASKSSIGASKAALRSGQSFVQVNQNGVKSQIAGEQRSATLSNFQQLRAPFDGVITARNVDVGSLVTAGGATTAQSPTATVTTTGLFGLARTDELRIQVSVPQAYFQSIASGTKVVVTVQELPGQRFLGEVAMMSGALDSVSRTRMTEIRLKNPQGILLPGMFAQISFATGVKEHLLRVPANALAIGADGTRVAIVRPDNTLHFQPVQLGRDFGNEAEVLSGLGGKEKLVSNPSSDLHEGMHVEVTHVVDAEPGANAAPSPAPPSAPRTPPTGR
ncbi:MAG: family efflux transporter, subunit [Chthonomonadales bacterium]|nr:family efflux transporter, subunit [Chthonomonadales bacterium]